MNKSVLRLLMVTSMAAGTSVAHAERLVIVNGQRLDSGQIAWLEQRNCAAVPNGYYWLDPRTGAWGYAGWPLVQGYLGSACGAARSQPRSLSERGQLYRPGEIINGR
jgi:hypothetical protein